MSGRNLSKYTREVFRKIRSAGHYCTLCGGKMAEDQKTIEHLIPRSRGGSNRQANLTRSCKPCNLARGSDTHVLPQFHTMTGELLATWEVKQIMEAAMNAMSRRPSPPVHERGTRE